MMYREFFQIEIAHEYYASGESVDLIMMPDQATIGVLKGQRLLIKDTGNGIRVLIPVDEDGAVKPLLHPGDALRFEVFPTSGVFGSFTDTSALGMGEIFLFTNAGLSEDNSQLASSSVPADSRSLKGFPLIAKIEIRIDETLLAGDSPHAYKVAFKAKSAKWRYYFVSDKEITELSIKNANNNGLAFDGLDLPEDTPDPIALSLRSNFPDADLFLFESNELIPCRSRAMKSLQLFRKNNGEEDNEGDVIIKHLPNPDRDIGNKKFRIIKVHK